MENKGSIAVHTVIVGGGMSGLFAASALRDHSGQFLLIESSKATLGGLASLGGIKIGMLPAGLSTAEYIGHSNYELFGNKFIKKYESFFSRCGQIANVELNEYFFNKRYESFIIEHKKVKAIVNSLKTKVQDKVIFSCVCAIEKMSDGLYGVQLKNGFMVFCKRILVASGRDSKTIQLFSNLGQIYKLDNEIMVGCRATFSSTLSSEALFRHQIDFKVKAKNSFQNYCYNHKGFLHPLRYCEKKYYSGSFDYKSRYGNTFIGKKIQTKNFEFLKFLDFSKVVSFNDLERVDFENLGQKYKDELMEFVDQFSHSFKIEFKKFFFPALEQFWPAPKLKMNCLESSTMPNIYFLGDSSGVAFGVLQCYILAHFLIEKLVNKNEIH